MPMQDYCSNCDRPLHDSQRVDAVYCGDDCRFEAHNTEKKIARATARAIQTIRDLQDILNGTGVNAGNALRALEQIALVAKESTGEVRWKCKDCGQLLFVKPVAGESCEFCGHTNFVGITPARQKRIR